MELIPIDADPCRFVARTPNLDMPLRRIFRLRWFLEAVKTNEMMLFEPQSWDDPREDPAMLCMLDGFSLVPPRGQEPLSAYLAPAWAQCWSINPGSDTLLRAYSSVRLDLQDNRNTLREDEGVTVTTTARRLLSAAAHWNAGGAHVHVVLGRVEYLDEDEIGQRIANICNGEHGPGFFRTVQGRAESLLWKRAYFSHEQEVRLLLVSRNWDQRAPPPAKLRVSIGPNALFSSVSFDPRLLTFEAREREAELGAAGYTGEIVPDLSYQKVLSQILLTRDWRRHHTGA